MHCSIYVVVVDTGCDFQYENANEWYKNLDKVGAVEGALRSKSGCVYERQTKSADHGAATIAPNSGRMFAVKIRSEWRFVLCSVHFVLS